MHFQYSCSTARPIDRIESILIADKKVATYKLALIRDAVVLRWADMTWRLSAGVLLRGKILDRLVLTSDPARFDESVRRFYMDLRSASARKNQASLMAWSDLLELC